MADNVFKPDMDSGSKLSAIARAFNQKLGSASPSEGQMLPPSNNGMQIRPEEQAFRENNPDWHQMNQNDYQRRLAKHLAINPEADPKEVLNANRHPERQGLK